MEQGTGTGGALTSSVRDLGARATGWTEHAGQLLVVYGPRVIGAMLFLLAAWVLSAWVSRAVRRGLERARVDLTLGKFLSDIARWTLLAVAAVACLGIFDVQTASFAAVFGALGLAIGLALQGSLGNIAAGVMLLIFRPFKVGDTVTVAGQTGMVDQVELFTTTLDTADNRRIIIPNGQIFGAVIENATYHGTRKVEMTVPTDMDADFDASKVALVRAAEGVAARLKERPVEVVAARISPGTGSVEWVVGVWTRTGDFVATREALLRSIKEHLGAAGIAIPSTLTQPKGVGEGPARGARA